MGQKRPKFRENGSNHRGQAGVPPKNGNSQGFFVCFHGSWNRSVPSGYKVVFVPLDKNNKAGRPKDFLWGFLQGAERVGRPVDVLTGPDGGLFISDDHEGRIFKVVYSGQKD